MTDTNATQTAVDTTKTPAAPGAEVTQDARTDGDELDTLLKEYDTTTAPPAATSAPPAQAAGTDDLKALTDQVKGLLTEQQQTKFRQDMDSTITKVRGNLDPELVDDETVEAWIDGQARKDPRLSQAWNERNSKPKQFEKVVETLGKNLAKKFSKLPDRQSTEDREAVAAAVRGASTKVPPAQTPDYSRMTPGEFQAEKDRLFGG